MTKKLWTALICAAAVSLFLVTAAADDGILTLPEDLTTIEAEAFQGLTSAGQIDLPAGVTEIQAGAFRNCGRPSDPLRYYCIPDGINVGDGAFDGCRARLTIDGRDIPYLQYAVNGDGVTVTGLYGYGAIQEAVIPATIEGKPVVAIGNDVFNGRNTLARVDIPATVASIGSDAFRGCSALSEIELPAALTSIGVRAFQDCVNLTSVSFPESLTTVESNAFYGVGSNARQAFCFDLGDNIDFVSGSSFENCPAILVCGLNTTTAERISNRGYSFVRADRRDEPDLRYRWDYFNHVWSWGLYDYVGGAASVRLPDDCANVNGERLAQKVRDGLALVCAQLSDTAAGVSRAGMNFTFPDHGDIRYRIINDVLYVMGWTGMGTVIDIPAAAAYIEEGWDEQIRADAFAGNATVTTLVIPEGVTRINANAFSGCYQLTDITLPDSLRSMDQKVFRYCGQDAEAPFYLTLPDHMEDLMGRNGGAHSFENLNAVLVCGKTSQTAALVTDRNYVYTCPGETDYRYRYESYAEGDEMGRRLWLVGYEGAGVTADIPAGAYGIKRFSANTTDSSWHTFHADAFYGNETVTRVVIPEGVETIRSDVFTNCYNLTDITFPSTLKSLDQNVFLWCGRDAEEPFYFVLPDNLESMVWRDGGATTFLDCNAVLVCGKTSRTAELLTYSRYVYTCPDEYDFRYRYEEYAEGDEAGRRVWLVGYVGEDAEVTIPAGIYGVKYYSSNTESNYWRTFYGYGFRNNETVTRVVIPEGTEVIEDSAFRGCVNLTDITFPSTLKVLKNHAFEQCGKNATTLHYYALPDDMEEISTNRSAGWGAFTDINLGRIVCTAGSETAYLVSNAYTNHYEGYYNFALRGHETDGLLYRYDRYDTDAEGVYDYRLVLKQYEGSDIEVTVPAGCGVWRIENNVFKDRNNLQRLILPTGVVELGESAFGGCAVLHEGAEQNVIRLPETIRRAGNLAFQNLGEAYTSQRFFLVLPASLNEFDINIFAGCNAVLVAPAGSVAASVLFSNWYYYYNTLEDAMAQENCQYQRYYVDGVEQEHVHYGRR